MAMDLSGAYPMSVDSKLRVTLPSVMRKELGKTVKLLPFEDCVYGFAPEEFQAFMTRVLSTPEHEFDERNRNDADLAWALRSSAVTVEVDSAGRIALGKLDTNVPGLCEAFGITGDVSIVGNGSRFEVWNAEKYAAKKASINLAALFYRD